jgi:hypothetical protein
MRDKRKAKKLYFGRRIPKEYDPKRLDPDFKHFETAKRIAREQSENLALLEKSHDYHPYDYPHDYTAVAEVLKKCTPEKPCMSAACAKCGTRYHRWFSACAMEAMDDCEELYLVTYVPEPDYPPTYPVQLWPDRLCDRFVRRLERGVGEDVKIVGFVEMSLSQISRCLVPHIHAIVGNATRKQLLACHPGVLEDGLIKRPWVVSKKPIPREERIKAFTYLYKVLLPQREFPFRWTPRLRRLRNFAMAVTEADLKVERLATLSEHFHADLAIVRGFKTRRGGRLYGVSLEHRRKMGFRQFKRRKR